jgi:hypothetical protein
VGFVVDKTALVQVFSEYFGLSYQAFHRLRENSSSSLSSSSSSRAGIIGQKMASVILDSVQHHSKEKKSDWFAYCLTDQQADHITKIRIFTHSFYYM